MEDGTERSGSEALSTSNVSTQDEHHDPSSNCPLSPPQLPQDWVAVGHNSGGIVYLHKPTRACTWARPYHVPPSKKIRQHSVPVGCVPCLYKSLIGPTSHPLVEKWLGDEESQKARLARIEPRRLREYLLLRWSPDGLSEATSKNVKQSTEDEPVKIIGLQPEEDVGCTSISSTVTVPSGGDTSSEGPDKGCSSILIPKHLRKHILQKTGKSVPKVWSGGSVLQSPLALLNQFCQGILKMKPDITVVECVGKDEQPYSASISLDSIWYGSGMGSTKKQAKQEAAEAVLDLLFDGALKTQEAAQEVAAATCAEFPVIADVDRSGVAYSSWQILKCCLSRNRDTLPGMDAISVDTCHSSSGQLMFSMSLGDSWHVEGHCVDSVEPRNTAAEALLLKLHPFVKDWSSLTRMYSSCAELVEGESRKRQHTGDGEGEGKSATSAKRGKWPPQSGPSLLEQLKVEMKALSKEYKAARDVPNHTKSMLLDTVSAGFSAFNT